MWMSISQNVSGGYPLGFTTASCYTGCLSMLCPQGRKSMTMPSAMAGGSHHLHKTWRQSHPSAVELAYANSMREDIAKIYQDMYQL